MTPDSPAGRPDRAVQLVEKIGDLACMPLEIDNDASGEGDERLLRKYSPRLVMLPDIALGADRPYPSGSHDYHPRPVEMYLGDVRPINQVPDGCLGWLNVLYTITAYIAAIAAGLMIVAEVDHPVVVPLIVGASVMAVVGSVIAGLYRYQWRTPADSAGLAELAKADDRARHFATTMFRTPGVGSPDLAWTQYASAVARSTGTPVVYGRAMVDGDFTVLQYWLFFYYNDWWNQHEADWEVAMVYLRDDQPVVAACSAHLGGTWRPWPSVERTADKPDHPTIYVARGSHALYFNTDKGTHDAVLHQPWAVFDIRGKLTVQGKQDRVGKAKLPGGTYELRTIPSDVADLRADAPDWADWWWLRYAGRWGAKDGILSPSIQEGGVRWGRPVDWASSTEADIGSWDEVVDAVLEAAKAATPAGIGAVGPAATAPDVMA